MTTTAGDITPQARQAGRDRLARLWRPLLGLVLPVGFALAWEAIVRGGLSDGRLVPPPSRIYAEFAELARSGELVRHISDFVADGGWLRFWRNCRHAAWCDRGIFGADPPPHRSEPSRVAFGSFNRLDSFVHPLARHIRDLKSCADRGWRFLSGLSRRHGGDPGRRS
jgi:hypothetical protein